MKISNQDVISSGKKDKNSANLSMDFVKYGELAQFTIHFKTHRMGLESF